jgi:hypothetical protein
MEMENRYASKGVGGTALGLSIGALGVEALRGGLGGIFGGGTGCHNGYSREDAAKDAKIAELTSEIKLRDATTFVLEEANKIRNYVDGKFDAVNAQLCTQAVFNAQVNANLSCLTNQVNVLSGLTKTVIPITSVCPEPMPATNTWVAPTTTG